MSANSVVSAREGFIDVVLEVADIDWVLAWEMAGVSDFSTICASAPFVLTFATASNPKQN